MIYLSGVVNPVTDSLKNYHDSVLPLGMMVQPGTARFLNRAGLYGWVGLDNGCFSEVGRKRFKLDDYFALIERAGREAGDYLLFATAPDVPMDWSATLAKSLPILPRIRQINGYTTAALVAQDGATVENMPWDEFDCLFIGGSTEWKLGTDSARLVREARRRRKWVHMGRVNSLRRILLAQSFGADSADGTYLRFTRADKGAEDVVGWLRETWKRQRCRCGMMNPKCLCCGPREEVPGALDVAA